jgi:hypothetical protein
MQTPATSLDTVRLWLPIGISLLALFVASLNFGWSIYKEIVLKARVRVSIAVVSLVTPGVRTTPKEQYVKLQLTNFGPGKVWIQMMGGKVSSPWRRMVRRVRHFVIMHDHGNAMNPRLPLTIEVGESKTLLMPYNERSVLNSNATHVGVYDSFGRHHFAPRKELELARATIRKDFPAAKPKELGQGWKVDDTSSDED